MDIFSFLPIIIFIYAIATIFNPGNKTPNKRRQSPFPPPDTWKDKFEEFEREMFSKGGDRIPPGPPQRQRHPEQPVKTERTPRTPDWARSRPVEIPPSAEGYGSEGYAGTEGLGTEGQAGGEGLTGTEGIAGTEGSWGGAEGAFGDEGAYGRTYVSEGISSTKNTGPAMIPKIEGSKNLKTQEGSAGMPVVSQASLMQGVIWAEVLGKPRARSGWSTTRRS